MSVWWGNMTTGHDGVVFSPAPSSGQCLYPLIVLCLTVVSRSKLLISSEFLVKGWGEVKYDHTFPAAAAAVAFGLRSGSFLFKIKTNICRSLALGRKCEEWGSAGVFVRSEAGCRRRPAGSDTSRLAEITLHTSCFSLWQLQSENRNLQIPAVTAESEQWEWWRTRADCWSDYSSTHITTCLYVVGENFHKQHTSPKPC